MLALPARRSPVRRPRRPPRVVLALLAAVGLGAAVPGPASAIVGGKPLDVATTPWLVQLRENGRQTCTGTLVRPRLVLTASHCLQGGLPTSVAFGRSSTGGSDGEVVGIGRYGLNPAFVRNQRRRSESLRADVAILELRRPPTAVAPIALGGAADRPLLGAGRRVVASGWGQTAGRRDRARGLRTVELPVRSSRLCRAFLRSGGYTPTSLVCTGSTSRTAGACFGDSGGPLYAVRGGAPVQLGVATSTTTRTCRRSPTIYNQTLRGTTRAWIDETIARAERTQTAGRTAATARVRRLPAAG